VSTEPVRILHITDTHLHAHRDATMRGLNTYDSFKAVVDRIGSGSRKADAVIATGDLVQDETRGGYEHFGELISGLGVPVHCVPGNHDSPRLMAEILSEPPFHFCGTAVYGNWCLIMLNTAVRGDDGGRLDQGQLEFLDHTLTAMQDRHALVALHHHPVAMGNQWLDGVGLRNSAEFFSVIDNHSNVRSIVWGHVHQVSDRERNGVKMLSTPSTGAQFLPGSDAFMLDDKPPGYRWLELMEDGNVRTEVVWL
jgi:Icc protein